MSAIVDWLTSKFLNTPLLKTAATVLSTIVTGVLSGTFVAEITAGGKLDWVSFYRAYSFYGLIAVALIIFFINRAATRFEQSIQNFADAEYCAAYVRAQCLPELAASYRAAIAKGETEAMDRARKEMQRILK